jgi:hypothetical protein
MSTLETLLETEDKRFEPIARLYSWSTNYEPGKGPFTAFLDLIGWSMEEIGETLYNFKDASLGYLELSYLASALEVYSDYPSDVMEYVNELISAEDSEQ